MVQGIYALLASTSLYTNTSYIKNRRAKERKKSRDGTIGTAIPGGKSTRQSASGSDGRSNDNDRQTDASSSSEIDDDDENEVEESNDKSLTNQPKPLSRNQAKRRLESRDPSPIDSKYRKVGSVWLP